MEIGDSDSLVVGQQVVAIGNALGYGQSVSEGIVSALNRSMDGGTGIYAEGLIQTDAAINPGNSGGALLNMKGQLVGINSAKYADTEVEGMLPAGRVLRCRGSVPFPVPRSFPDLFRSFPVFPSLPCTTPG